MAISEEEANNMDALLFGLKGVAIRMVYALCDDFGDYSGRLTSTLLSIARRNSCGDISRELFFLFFIFSTCPSCAVIAGARWRF